MREIHCFSHGHDDWVCLKSSFDDERRCIISFQLFGVCAECVNDEADVDWLNRVGIQAT